MRSHSCSKHKTLEGRAYIVNAVVLVILVLFACPDFCSAQANPGRMNTLQYTRPTVPAPVPEVERLKQNQARMYRYMQTGDPRLEQEIERFLGVRPVPSLGRFQPRRPGDLPLEREIQNFLGAPTGTSLGSQAPPRPRPVRGVQPAPELPPTDPDSEPCLVKPYLRK